MRRGEKIKERRKNLLHFTPTLERIRWKRRGKKEKREE